MKKIIGLVVLVILCQSGLWASEEGRKNTRNFLAALTAVAAVKGNTALTIVGGIGTAVAQSRLNKATTRRHERQAYDYGYTDSRYNYPYDTADVNTRNREMDEARARQRERQTDGYLETTERGTYRRVVHRQDGSIIKYNYDPYTGDQYYDDSTSYSTTPDCISTRRGNGNVRTRTTTSYVPTNVGVSHIPTRVGNNYIPTNGGYANTRFSNTTSGYGHNNSNYAYDDYGYSQYREVPNARVYTQDQSSCGYGNNSGPAIRSYGRGSNYSSGSFNYSRRGCNIIIVIIDP